MSFLDQLKSKRCSLKTTVTNITHVDGTQEQIVLSSGDLNNQRQGIHLEPKVYGFVVDTNPDQIPACIVENFLYLGSQDSVTLENVNTYHLTDILSVDIETPTTDIVYGDGSNSTVCKHFVECLDLPETQLNEVLKNTNDIIESVQKKNGRILVHCNAGVSRSSTVCIAYLMTHRKMLFESAFELVKSKRECIRPNDGFLKHLKQLDKVNKC